MSPQSYLLRRAGASNTAKLILAKVITFSGKIPLTTNLLLLLHEQNVATLALSAGSSDWHTHKKSKVIYSSQIW